MDNGNLGTCANIDLSMFKGENKRLARSLLEIVEDMRAYWPLTVRQIYYQAVSKLVIPNADAKYRAVSRCLTELRRGDLMPWYAIEDRTRRTTDKRGMSSLLEFVEEQMKTAFNPLYYQRCLVQMQKMYIEVATEKDALSSVLENAIWPYCTRLNIVRGQVSATMVNDMAERFGKAIFQGKRPILLYMGDLDPSGVAIPKALRRNLRDHHDTNVEVVRVALNPEQVKEYGLPVDYAAAKKSDPNYRAWLEEYGSDQAAVELDALHPEDLTKIIQGALELVYNMGEMALQKVKEQKERALLGKIHHRIQDVVWDEFRNRLEELK